MAKYTQVSVHSDDEDSIDTEIKFSVFSKTSSRPTAKSLIQDKQDKPQESRKTPSPKKLLRPTNDCMNVQLLLKEDDDEAFRVSEDEEDAKPVNVYKDEFPELSEKMKAKFAKGPTKRKQPANEANYVKANLKRKRYASKKGGNANVNRFKRFKRK